MKKIVFIPLALGLVTIGFYLYLREKPTHNQHASCQVKSDSLIIIGSGPAGLTAGIYASRSNLKPLILEGDNLGGQLMGAARVENWPGEKNISGQKLMLNIRNHVQSLGCKLLSETVTKVDFSQNPFTLWTDHNKELKAHAVIIATGTTPNRLGCPGESEYWGKGRGVATCVVCDGSLYKDKKVVIIGGGRTALKDALFLTEFTKDVMIIQNSDKLTAPLPLQKQTIENPNIKIIYNSKVTSINGNSKNVSSISIHNTKTNKPSEIPVDGVFIAIGTSPNTELFKGQIALDPYGYISVSNQTSTSLKGIFAAGCVTGNRCHQAITSAGIGSMAAMDAEQYLHKIFGE